MIIKHLPSPVDAQPYRIPKVWSGDMDSEIAQSMKKVNVNGHLAGVVTKVTPDPHAGFIATARIFSGKVVKGTDVRMVGKRKNGRLQQVSIYKGPHRIQVDEVVAGNIVGLVGIQDAFSGETICDPDFLIQPFEQIKHMFEPVVTKALEPKNPRDLTKLINFLKKLAREDTTIAVKINQETGEYLVSGLGELHIDAKVERKLKEQGLDVRASPPIVVYRESITGKSPEIEGKSPNKHNRFYFIVEPLEKEFYEAMKEDEIPSTYDLKKKNLELIDKLKDLGMSADDVKNLEFIYERNMLFSSAKGVQYLNEAMEMIKDGFKSIMDEGPLSREPCYGVKATLVDASLHEDPVHRGPGQVLPAIRHGITTGMLLANACLLEPKQIIRIDVPTEVMGGAIREVQNRRGQVLGMDEERGMTIIRSKLPVAEMFGFNSELKSATGGKGFYSLIDVIYEKLPKSLRDKTILQIRKRKGLSQQIPKVES
jgi:elongation factor 2